MENKNQVPNVFMWMFWKDNKKVYLIPQNEVIPVNQISDSIIKSIYILSSIGLLIFNNKKTTTFMQADNSCPKQKTL